MTGKQLFALGARRAVPIALGYVPVGVAYAVYAAQTGFSPFEIVVMSLTSYSGSGQFLAVSMVGAGAALPVTALALFLMNCRYFIMSACVFRLFRKLTFLQRGLLAHFVTDETFAVFTTSEKELIGVPYFLGLFLTSWISWSAGAVLGVLAHSVLPPEITLALGIALYALFIAIIVPPARGSRRMGLLIAGAAALNTLLCQVFDQSAALVLTTLGAAAIGALLIKSPAGESGTGAGSEADDRRSGSRP